MEGPEEGALARLRGQRATEHQPEGMRLACLELEVAVLRAMIDVQDARLDALTRRIDELERPAPSAPARPARPPVRRGLGRGISALITAAADSDADMPAPREDGPTPSRLPAGGSDVRAFAGPPSTPAADPFRRLRAKAPRGRDDG